MTEGSSSRRVPRYRIGLSVAYTHLPRGEQELRTGTGRIRDLSEQGACLELEEALAPGTSLHVVFQTEDGVLTLEAAVVWVGHPPLPEGRILHGVRFAQTSPDQRQALQTLLQHQDAARPRSHRLPIALPVQCSAVGVADSPLRGWTGDLSQGGCSLLLPDRLAVGTLLDLTLTTPRGDFATTATVVWVERSAEGRSASLTRHGVRFIDSTVGRGLITDFIEEENITKTEEEPERS